MNENRSGKQLLNRINQVSFAVDDLLLYLDTHPCDERALMLCRKMVKERKELSFFQDASARRIKLMNEYAEKYGPLTIDNAAKSDENSWKWMEQPFPWEREGGCR